MEEEGRRNFLDGRRSPRDCKLPGHFSSPLTHSVTRTLQETDKATIDVEAQDDGILAKIIVCFLAFVSFDLSPHTVLGK
jgi:hypothetical protein